MKKMLNLMLIITMFTIFPPLNFAAHAENEPPRKINVYLDGERLVFDIAPQIIDDRIMVPFRAIFEALGMNVEWFSKTQQIVANADGVQILALRGFAELRRIRLRIGSYEMRVYDSWGFSLPVTLNVAPQIVDNRALVPLRAISEAFHTKVEWDVYTRTVTITSQER